MTSSWCRSPPPRIGSGGDRSNRPFDPARFDALYGRLLAYLQGSDVYVQDCFAGVDPAHRVPIRIVTEYAWHNLFARQVFVRPDWTTTQDHVPRFTVIDVPKFHAYPELDGTRSEAFVVVHFGKGLVIIGGTSYAGEMKKSVFTLLNFLLPLRRVLVDALLGESGASRGRGPVLRIVGNREDHTLGRPGATADRGRRTWVEQRWGLQL